MSTAYEVERPDLESSTEEYARRFAGSVGEFFIEVQWNAVREMLPPATNCRVLDVGGGHAQLAAPMVDAGYDVTVMGSDEACVRRLNRTVGPNRYNFVAGDLLDLPVESKSFDVVLAFRLLPHLRNWQRFLAELCRVSKLAVIVDYPDLRSVNWFATQLFALKRSVEKNTRTYKCFDRREVIDAFAQNQFELAKLKGQFVLPMALHRMMRTATISRLTETVAKQSGLTQLFGSPVILKVQRQA